MKRVSGKKNNNHLRPEYDLSKLKGGLRGKYYKKATTGTNIVLIEPELNEVFPDTAASVTGRKGNQATTPNKRLKRRERD
jgi:hypothetical protein